MQHHAADQLHVEGRKPMARLAASRTTAKASFDGIERCAGGEPWRNSSVLPRSSASESLAIPGSSAVMSGCTWPQRFDAAVVGGAEDFAGHAAETDHPLVLSIPLN